MQFKSSGRDHLINLDHVAEVRFQGSVKVRMRGERGWIQTNWDKNDYLQLRHGAPIPAAPGWRFCWLWEEDNNLGSTPIIGWLSGPDFKSLTPLLADAKSSIEQFELEDRCFIADTYGHCWRWSLNHHGEWKTVAGARGALQKEPTLRQREVEWEARERSNGQQAKNDGNKGAAPMT